MLPEKFYSVRLYNASGVPLVKYSFDTLEQAIECIKKYDSEWYVQLEAIHIVRV